MEGNGHGTWVTHPELVTIAREVFDPATWAHQTSRKREDLASCGISRLILVLAPFIGWRMAVTY